MSTAIFTRMQERSRWYNGEAVIPNWLLVAPTMKFSPADQKQLRELSENSTSKMMLVVTIKDGTKVLEELFMSIGMPAPSGDSRRSATKAIVEALQFLKIPPFTGRVTVTLNNLKFKYPNQTWEEVK